MFMHKTILVVSFSAILAGWLCGLYGFYRPQPWIEQQSEVFATGIPWLQSEAACIETGRVWQEETCWDNEHGPMF
jgi:hypothetical protein